MEAKVNGERVSSGPVVQKDVGIGCWYSLVRGELVHVIDGVPSPVWLGYLDSGVRDWERQLVLRPWELGHMTQCPLMEFGTEPVLALGPMRCHEALHRPRPRDVSPSL